MNTMMISQTPFGKRMFKKKKGMPASIHDFLDLIKLFVFTKIYSLEIKIPTCLK